MNIFIKAVSALLLIIGISVTAFANSDQRVLMVVSGYGEDQGKTKPGYEFGEFAAAYLVFKNNGLEVDVASPQGGMVEADRFDPKSTQNAIVLADSDVMAKLHNTMAVSEVDPANYASIFIVGGKGAMFDFPENKPLQTVIAAVYEQGGVVSAVCHGPAALTNVKLTNGSYLVDGKDVNSFTNVEERLFGQKWMPEFDFMLEDKLKERGANFNSSPMMLSHVAQDGRLITGQNPSSTPAVAEAVVRSLGLEPAPRGVFGDEQTFALIAQILEGNVSASAMLDNQPEKYNRPLVGMYGYFYAQAAQSDTEVMRAIQLMNMAPEALSRPEVHLQVAKSHIQIAQIAKARSVLVDITTKHPDFAPAQELLKTL